MTHPGVRRDAVARLLLAGIAGDCVDLVERYLAELGRPAKRPPPPLTARKVAAVLGRPSRRARYGDVVLFRRRPDPDAVLGINLGYCVLTALEERPGALARVQVPPRLLAWSV